MHSLYWLVIMGCSWFSEDSNQSKINDEASTEVASDSPKYQVKIEDSDTQQKDEDDISEDAEPLPPLAFTYIDSISDMTRQTRLAGKPYLGQFIDTIVHIWFHRTEDTDIQELEKVLDDKNVSKIVFMPTPFQGSNPRADKGTARIEETLQKKAGKQKKLQSLRNKNRSVISTRSTKQSSHKIAIIRGLGAQRVGWFCDSQSIATQLKGDEAVVEGRRIAITKRARTDLSNPLCIGLGEIGIAHGAKREGQPSIFIDIDHGILMEVFDDVMRAEKWMYVHLEPLNVEIDTVSNETVFQGLVKVCRQFPSARLIVSHTMMTNPQNVRNVLETCPNVYTNIKILHQEWENWKLLEPIHNSDGQIYEDWAKLFEDMPTRFFIGSDFKLWRETKDDAIAYGKTVEEYRRMLGTLQPSVAEQIAYKNAERLLFAR